MTAKNVLPMEFVDANTGQKQGVIRPPFEMWAGAGNIGPLGLPTNTIGFNNSAGATSTWILHAYNAETNAWTASTQTFDGFVGL